MRTWVFSATIRDLGIRCHTAGILRIHWTTRILEETFTWIERERPDLDPARLQRTRRLVNAAARGRLVVRHERAKTGSHKGIVRQRICGLEQRGRSARRLYQPTPAI